MSLYSPDIKVQNYDQAGNNPDTGTFGSGYDLAGYYLNPEDEKNKFLFSPLQLRIFEMALKTDPNFRNLMVNNAKKIIKENPELTREGLIDKFKSLMVAGAIAMSAIASPSWMNAFAATDDFVPSKKDIKQTLHLVKFYPNELDTVLSSRQKDTLKWIKNHKSELLKVKDQVKNLNQKSNNKPTISVANNNSSIKVKDQVKNLNQKSNNKPTLSITKDTSAPKINNSEFSPRLIKYIKKVENAGQKGKRTVIIDGKPEERWFPHKSPEGGKMTIGYGHKLTANDEQSEKIKQGLTNAEVEYLLIKDLNKAKQTVQRDLHTMEKKGLFKLNKPLTQTQQEILIDYAFNLGTITGFPKFTTAVINGDIDTMRKEYKRYYGGGIELTGRNSEFRDTFLK